MKKIIFSLVVAALIIGVLAPIPGADSRVKAYHSGSAVYYNDYIVVGTANSGLLEIFKIDQAGNLQKFVNLKAYDQRFGTEKDFYDVMLRAESGRLYAYAVDGRALYKYDISDLKQAQRLKRVEDSSWDWFGGLTLIDGKVATIGSRGVKVWNSDLAVIDSFALVNKGDKTNTYNITPAGSDKFLFNIFDNKITIFDCENRAAFTTVPLTFNWGSDWYKRSVYNDKIDNMIYVVDDESVKKINFKGEIVKSFDHTGPLGYDVVASADGGYVYFSDGIGVVKLRKSDLKVMAYTYTTDLGMGNGWSMGLQTVKTDNGEKLVVFNNTSIIVLDSNLKPMKANSNQVVFAAATLEDPFPEVSEALFLAIDKNRAAADSKVMLRGGGYGKDETIVIDFGGVQTMAEASADGRFNQELTVPKLKAGSVDIKVSGMSTAYTYSLGFKIE